MEDESRAVLGEAERFASITTPPPSVPLGSSAGAKDSTVCNLKTIRRENKGFPWPRWESNMTERPHFHFSLLCIGEGNGNPLQCSCLENPRDGGAWWAAVYGIAQSRTQLKRLSGSSSRVSLHQVVSKSYFEESSTGAITQAGNEYHLCTVKNCILATIQNRVSST